MIVGAWSQGPASGGVAACGGHINGLPAQSYDKYLKVGCRLSRLATS